MKKAQRLMLGALACGALASAAAAAESIHVRNAWMPAYTDDARSAPVFLTLVNLGAKSDRLVGVKADGAAVAGIRVIAVENGEARQRELTAVELPPGVPVPLQAGGAYLVLEGLKAPLKPRAAQTIRLVFQNAGERELRVKVRPEGLGDDPLENLRTDPLQVPIGKPAHSEGVDEALRTDPFQR